MTKAQIKAAIHGVFNKVFDKELSCDSLRKLMDLNEQFGDGHRWCSYDANLIGIIQGGDKQAIGKALHIYNEFCEMQGAVDAMHEIAKATNSLYF